MPEDQPTFRFYEIVRVRPGYCADEGDPPVAGLEGAILGMSEAGEGGWTYAVFLAYLGEVWCFDEADLESTGRVERRETFYDDDISIRVFVDPETGAGRLATDRATGDG